jgi:hypothetical protein
MGEEVQAGPPRAREPAPALPPEPPPCPPAWVTGPPHFVGVGAQRCGTTWWHRQIALHPQVVFERGRQPKEVHFFDSLAGVDALSPEQVERYARFFPRPQSGGVAGEWSPRYMFDPWAVPLLAQAAPRARILVLLRDPVERYASGFAWESRLARRRGEAGLSPEMVAEQSRLRGHYAAQVGRVLESFPREQVLILQYERCRAHYDEELERTYDFLGLERAFRPVAERNAPEAPTERDLPPAERARLAREYAPDVRRLAEIGAAIDVSLWPSVRDLI